MPLRRRPRIAYLENAARERLGLPALKPVVHSYDRTATISSKAVFSASRLSSGGYTRTGTTYVTLKPALERDIAVPLQVLKRVTATFEMPYETLQGVREQFSSPIDTTKSTPVEQRSAAQHLAVEGYAVGIAGIAYAITYNVSGDNVWVAVGLTGVAYGIARWQTRGL